MVSISDIFLSVVTTVIATSIILIIFFKRRFTHWKNMGLECPEPSIPFGNFQDSFNQEISVGEWFARFYTNFKAKGLRHGGCYTFFMPIYVPIDLDLIKRVMQLDFAHFTDHKGYYNEKNDPLSATVFALGGQRWKNLRVKLTPTFTSGKMKLMFPIMVKISHEFVDTVQQECKQSPIDVTNISARFTTDVIGNCAFGIDCNSLNDPNTEFRVKGKMVFHLTWWEMFKNVLGFNFPNLMRFFGMRLFRKDATDFFWNVIKSTAEYREKNGVRRNDAFQLMLDMVRKEGEVDENKLSFSELAAQAFVFFIAGFETSSTLLSFALFELSLNEDVQDRLREEINEVLRKNNGEFTYEALFEMRYLEMVINETLRKHPPAPTISRECTKDYQVPDSNVVLREGDTIMLPIRGIHYDPEYYPNPQKFDPKRFTEENKSKRHQFTFLPFGEGPRVCLGLRFGLMQAKVGLASLVKNFKFKINPKTEVPLKLDPKIFLTAPLGGLWIDVEKIN